MPIVTVYHHDHEGALFNTDCTAGSLIAALTEVANTGASRRHSHLAGGAGPYSKVELLPLSFVMDLANNSKVVSALSPHRAPSVVAAMDSAESAAVAAEASTGVVASSSSSTSKPASTGSRASASFASSSNMSALTAMIHNVPFSGLLFAPVQQLASETLATTLTMQAGTFSGSGGGASGSTGNGGGAGGTHGHAHSGNHGATTPTYQNAYVLLGCRETIVDPSATPAPYAITTSTSTATAGGGASSAARMLKQQQQQVQGHGQQATNAASSTLQQPAPSQGSAFPEQPTQLSAQAVSQLVHQAQSATETPVPSSSLSPDAANAVLTAAEVAKLLSTSAHHAQGGSAPHHLTLVSASAAGALPGHDEEGQDVVSAPKLFTVSIEEEEQALLQRVAAAAEAERTTAGAATTATTDTAEASGPSGRTSGSSSARRRSPSTKRMSSVGKELHSVAGDAASPETDPNQRVGQPPVLTTPVPLSRAAVRLLHGNTAGSGGPVIQANLQTCNVTIVKGQGASGAGAMTSSSSSSAAAAAAGGTGAGGKQGSATTPGLVRTVEATPTQHLLERLESFDVLWRGPHNEQEILRAFLHEYVRALKQRYEAVQSSLHGDGAGGAGGSRRSTVNQNKSRKR